MARLGQTVLHARIAETINVHDQPKGHWFRMVVAPRAAFIQSSSAGEYRPLLIADILPATACRGSTHRSRRAQAGARGGPRPTTCGESVGSDLPLESWQ